jgi:hypothetical protein
VVLHREQKIAEGPEMEIHDPYEGRKHCTENPIYVFPKKELCGLSPNFFRFIYSQDWSTYLAAAKIDRPILEIYKSLTDI